jgi:alanine racemase
MYRNTFVEVDLDAIAENTQTIRKAFDGYEYFFGVLKGSAYGHGEYIVNTLIENGVNYVAVSTIEEALAVRKFNKTVPILCLIPVDQKHIDTCLDNNLTITIHDLDYAISLSRNKISKKLKVHLKVDSGMHRLGFTSEKDIKVAFEAIQENKNIQVEGVYTHFATSGIYDPYYNQQVDNFLKIASSIPLNEIPIIHMDRSLTVMSHKKLPFSNGMRIGISLYGFNQLPRASSGIRGKLRTIKNKLRSKILKVHGTSITKNIQLRPALSMFSEVIQVKKVKQGSLVGYGETIAKTDMQLAVVSAGYADGIDLRRTGSYVVINGKRCKVLGSINMNSIIVSVDGKINVGDKVDIISDKISTREVSAHIGTTVYETITSIPSGIPRIYLKNGKLVHAENR